VEFFEYVIVMGSVVLLFGFGSALLWVQDWAEAREYRRHKED
jgi:hypothetical protein